MSEVSQVLALALGAVLVALICIVPLMRSGLKALALVNNFITIRFRTCIVFTLLVSTAIGLLLFGDIELDALSFSRAVHAFSEGTFADPEFRMDVWNLATMVIALFVGCLLVPFLALFPMFSVIASSSAIQSVRRPRLKLILTYWSGVYIGAIMDRSFF